MKSNRWVLPPDAEQKMLRLRILLNELGFYTFEVNENQQRTPFDIIAFRKGTMGRVFWLYPTPKNRIMVRPWMNAADSRRFSYNEEELRDHRKKFRLIRSATMPTTPNWHDWITPLGKEEARQLRLPI